MLRKGLMSGLKCRRHKGDNEGRSDQPGGDLSYTSVCCSLQVFLQNVGIHFGPGGLKVQCPETPTCEQPTGLG